MTSPRTRGISARISEEVYVALCALANAQGLTLSALAARLLDTGSQTSPTVAEATPSGHGTHHGWVSPGEEGALFFLLPTPEPVLCPGCGAEGLHLWMCWGCGLFFLTECAGEGACFEGWPLEEFQVEPNGEHSSHLTPAARPPLASPCDARKTST